MDAVINQTYAAAAGSADRVVNRRQLTVALHSVTANHLLGHQLNSPDSTRDDQFACFADRWQISITRSIEQLRPGRGTGHNHGLTIGHRDGERLFAKYVHTASRRDLDDYPMC